MAWDRSICIGGTGQYSIAEEDAKLALLGYAFGQTLVEWGGSDRAKQEVTAIEGSAPGGDSVSRYLWSYRNFDCVPTDPYRLTIADVALTAALDSNIGSKTLSQIEAVLEKISDALTESPVHQTFWALPLASVATLPPSGNVARGLWHAWAIAMNLQGIDVAITHKMLHRKRPWLFPMLDRQTIPILGGYTVPNVPYASDPWVTIHYELNTYQLQFEELERWFAKEAASRGAVPLTRLRIHDILVWGWVTHRDQHMVQLGKWILHGPIVPNTPEWDGIDPALRDTAVLQSAGISRVVRHSD